MRRRGTAYGSFATAAIREPYLVLVVPGTYDHRQLCHPTNMILFIVFSSHLRVRHHQLCLHAVCTGVPLALPAVSAFARWGMSGQPYLGTCRRGLDVSFRTTLLASDHPFSSHLILAQPDLQVPFHPRMPKQLLRGPPILRPPLQHAPHELQELFFLLSI
jgi:hypothetical protein